MVQDDEKQFDLLVVSKFKNARLAAEIFATEKSLKKLAEEIGVSNQTLASYANLRKNPWRKKKEFTPCPAAEKIADYFGVSPLELFPLTLYELSLPKEVERKFKSVELLPLLAARKGQYLLPDQEQAAAMRDTHDALMGFLKDFPEREQKVIEQRFGLLDGKACTIQEIADSFGVHSTRVRQIESKALRRFRHPSRARKLRDHLCSPPKELTYVEEKKEEQKEKKRKQELISVEKSREELVVGVTGDRLEGTGYFQTNYGILNDAEIEDLQKAWRARHRKERKKRRK